MSLFDQHRFGDFGGCYAPELLIPSLQELDVAFSTAKQDQEFVAEFHSMLKHYAGRPTPLTEITHFSEAVDGPHLYLKREDLLHTGAHKLNNALGQCLLAKRLGKTRIIAETGAGQHGVATATVCAYLGLPCQIYMGKVDAERQQPNVKRMRLMGAEVIEVTSGTQTLKDAVNEALRDWSASFSDTHYCLGSALGPAPFPAMVEYFQSVIGAETKLQAQEQFNAAPDKVIACVGGGSNAIGIFSAFIDDANVELIGVEAGGKGASQGGHAARFLSGRPGVLHGTYSYVLQDKDGQILPTHSISAGLDYAGVGPRHAALHQSGRAQYNYATDDEVIAALKLLAKTEGIIPALESAHALAYVVREAKNWNKEEHVIINLSGRGDKDLPQLFERGLV